MIFGVQIRQFFSSILCLHTSFGVHIRQSDFLFTCGHFLRMRFFFATISGSFGVQIRQLYFSFSCLHFLRMRFFFATISGSVTSPNNALRGSRLPSSSFSIFLFILAVLIQSVWIRFLQEQAFYVSLLYSIFIVQMLSSDVYTLSDNRKMKQKSSCLCKTLCLFTRNHRCLIDDFN